jgi:hypothetical protein
MVGQQTASNMTAGMCRSFPAHAGVNPDFPHGGFIGRLCGANCMKSFAR